jgi:hypothetical protein
VKFSTTPNFGSVDFPNRKGAQALFAHSGKKLTSIRTWYHSRTLQTLGAVEGVRDLITNDVSKG